MDPNLARHVSHLVSVLVKTALPDDSGLINCTWHVQVSKDAMIPEPLKRQAVPGALTEILNRSHIEEGYIRLLTEALKTNLGKEKFDLADIKSFNLTSQTGSFDVSIKVRMNREVTNLYDDIGPEVVDRMSAKIFKAILQSLVDVELETANLIKNEYQAGMTALNRLKMIKTPNS